MKRTAEELCSAIIDGCTDEFLEDLRQNEKSSYVSLVRSVISRKIQISGNPEINEPLRVIIKGLND